MSSSASAPRRARPSWSTYVAASKATEKIRPFVDDATKHLIDDLVRQLAEASADDEDAARTALERVIREHGYLL